MPNALSNELKPRDKPIPDKNPSAEPSNPMISASTIIAITTHVQIPQNAYNPRNLLSLLTINAEFIDVKHPTAFCHLFVVLPAF
jgi:hypothetical protein